MGWSCLWVRWCGEGSRGGACQPSWSSKFPWGLVHVCATRKRGMRAVTYSVSRLDELGGKDYDPGYTLGCRFLGGGLLA